VQVTKVLWY